MPGVWGSPQRATRSAAFGRQSGRIVCTNALLAGAPSNPTSPFAPQRESECCCLASPAGHALFCCVIYTNYGVLCSPNCALSASLMPAPGLFVMHKTRISYDGYGVIIHANHAKSLQQIQCAFHHRGVHARQIGNHFRVIRDVVRDIQRAVSVRLGGEIDQHDVQQNDVHAILLPIQYAYFVAVKEADGQFDGARFTHICLRNGAVPVLFIDGRIRFLPPVIVRNGVAFDVLFYGVSLLCFILLCSCLSAQVLFLRSFPDRVDCADARYPPQKAVVRAHIIAHCWTSAPYRSPIRTLFSCHSLPANRVLFAVKGLAMDVEIWYSIFQAAAFFNAFRPKTLTNVNQPDFGVFILSFVWQG